LWDAQDGWAQTKAQVELSRRGKGYLYATSH
jgi:hypothetical protein